MIKRLQPYVEKARRGEGAVRFSIPGTAVCCFIAGGLGYLVKKRCGVVVGVSIGLLVNLPWNAWFLKKRLGD